MAPVWFLVLVILGNIAIFAGQESDRVSALGTLLLLVAFGSLGRKVLGMSDATADRLNSTPSIPLSRRSG